MTRPFRRLIRFFQELRRRIVYKVAVTCVVVGVATLQVAKLLFPATTLEGAYDVLVLVAFVGFPFVLVFAWAFEITPDVPGGGREHRQRRP